MNPDKSMPNETHENPNLPSARPLGSALQTYMFRRAGGWYLMELKDDTEARANAECNVGTVKVEDIYGRQVWPNEKAHARREEPRT